MARYQLTLAYDGADFFGSQRQAKNAGSSLSRPRTVQGEIEKALRELGWKERTILLSGRTDTGVHATGQVVSFDLDWTHSDDELVRALNSLLPADLAVRDAKVTHAEFHPRFDATSRRYQYKLFCRSLRDPFRERFAWRVFPPVKTEVLNAAAILFLGTHDFSAFGSATTPKGTTVRTVTKAEWTQTQNDEWQFDVQADAFLYRMVRRLVFVQVAVAQGKFPVEAIAQALAKQPAAGKRSGLPSGLAPANGLTLVEVIYEESMK
jgi:tRNA pseudouridine38-40 synthase